MKTSVGALFCVCLSMPLSMARAAEPVDTAQGVIQKQIDAFLNDDARTAYSFASPVIRQRFPDADAFFDMVRKSYAPVYRPGNFAFGRARVEGDMVAQEVLISGPDGKDWTALYQVVRQPDGGYRINGVHLAPTAPGPDI